MHLPAGRRYGVGKLRERYRMRCTKMAYFRRCRRVHQAKMRTRLGHEADRDEIESPGPLGRGANGSEDAHQARYEVSLFTTGVVSDNPTWPQAQHIEATRASGDQHRLSNPLRLRIAQRQ